MPRSGQGALGLIIREDDDLATELAYTLQHRPSFVRVQAERVFARTLAGSDLAVGSLATTNGSGELTLKGATVQGEQLVQAEARGPEANAEALGCEVAKQVKEQLHR